MQHEFNYQFLWKEPTTVTRSAPLPLTIHGKAKHRNRSLILVRSALKAVPLSHLLVGSAGNSEWEPF